MNSQSKFYVWVLLNEDRKTVSIRAKSQSVADKKLKKIMEEHKAEGAAFLRVQPSPQPGSLVVE
jgi:hypothetical protein